MTHLFWSSLGLGIAFCATPGAVNAESLRRGVARGFWPALLVQLGSLVGDMFWAAAALTGTALLVGNRQVLVVLAIVGGCFLLRLAYTALRDAWTPPSAQATIPRRTGDFVTGMAFSLTNPFALAFWLGMGAGIAASATAHPGGATVAFLSGFFLGALGWCLVSAAAITQGRQYIGTRVFRYLNAACGLTLGYFGVKLLFTTLRGLRLARIFVG